MKTPISNRRPQRGVALLLMLGAVLLAGGYGLYRQANRGNAPYSQAGQLATTLARAKDALLARAASDANRPGSLPCPDLLTDSAGLANRPGDGKADMLTRNACPSYVGWLPWVTLDLPELTDDSGSRLWYVLAPALRDDDNAPPLNSDTSTLLSLDGNADIAALIIAPGAALGRQSRPSTNPADYLDGDNGNGDDHRYVSGPPGSAFNDRVAVISRQELLAAVEKRVAGEVKACLEQHAAAAANASHAYPWPAPLGATNSQGKAGSRFGRLPATQPGSGAQTQLPQSIGQLRSAADAVRHAGDAGQQLVAVHNLNETLTQARNLFDALYLAASKLWQAAQSNGATLLALDKELVKDLKAGSSGTVSIINSEQTRIRSLAAGAAGQLDLLPEALADNGIDIFPEELKSRAAAFTQSANPANALALVELLSRSHTTHGDLAPLLTNAAGSAGDAWSSAQSASGAPSDGALRDAAQTAAKQLLAAVEQLQTGLRQSRTDTHASEIRPYSSLLQTLNATLQTAPGPGPAADLAGALGEAKQRIERLASGASAVVRARGSALLALDSAEQAARAATDFPLIDATTGRARQAIEALVASLPVNDDNLTRSSVAAATAQFKAAQSVFAEMTITSSAERAPYAVSLQTATVNVEFWAKIIGTRSSALAAQARALPPTGGPPESGAQTLDGSAYQAASSALGSNQNGLDALRSYLNTPTASRQAAAASALSATLVQVDSLLARADSLAQSNSSSVASAFPIIWLSARCDAWQATAASWWQLNQWQALVFYQIAAANPGGSPGRLTVNGQDGYRLVILAASQALPGQSRTTPGTAQYLEGANADASRDGDALFPKRAFESRAPQLTASAAGPAFNDRVAY